MLGKSIKWFWQDYLVTPIQTAAKQQEPNPLEARLQKVESELKRVIKPIEVKNGSIDQYFNHYVWYSARPTLEDRIQALEDAKKPRCRTCKKIK